MTERDRAIVRDLVARRLLDLTPKPQHPPARSEGTVAKLEKRIRHLERTIADLHERLDNADRRIKEADARAEHAERQRDRAQAQAAEAQQLLDNVANRKHLDAERQVLTLRRHIANLERAAGYTDTEAA